ncbi:MAG: response regulator [Acidobacteriota bacterium]
MNYKILIVDDEELNTRMLERVFRSHYDVVTAQSGGDGLEKLMVHDIALIISDQRMPGMTGVEFLVRAAELRPHCVRIILTGYTDSNDLADALNSNVVYKFVTKPWDNSDLLQTVKRGLSHHETIKAQHRLNLENQRLRSRLDAYEDGLSAILADQLEMRAPGAREHAKNVCSTAEQIGRALELDPPTMKLLTKTASMHDLGELFAYDQTVGSVLSPSDPVRTMQEHGRVFELLAEIPDLAEVVTALRQQSEHFDGTGGPDGLLGEQISLIARIVSVACASELYQASGIESRERFQAESGHRFDPNIVNVLHGLRTLDHLREGGPLSAAYLNN